MKKYFGFIICLAGCIASRNPSDINLHTGYINNVKTQADIENNRRVEKQQHNLSPLYNHKNESARLKLSDDVFIRNVLKDCKCDSVQAGNIFAFKAWTFFRSGNNEIASKRFNQAYLFDTTNYKIYWGFGDIMAKQNRDDEAIPLYNRAFTLYKSRSDSDFVFLSLDATNPYIDKFMQTKNKAFVDAAFSILDKAAKILPDFPQLNNLYSHLYFETGDYSRALDYYNKTVASDKRFINSDYLKSINDKLGTK